MSGIRFSVAVGIVSLLMALGLTLPAQAAAVCKALDNPAACTPAFNANQQMSIKSGVPFIWLRNDAKSSAAVAHTVNYSTKARFVIEYSPSVYDGYQNWWLVHLVSDKSKAGWVEQSSLVGETAPESQSKANWTTTFKGGIRAGVPFIWIRTEASSSAPTLDTLWPGDSFLVFVKPEPINDGQQWWWFVSTQTEAGPKEGYVEQASLVNLGDYVATPVPTNVADTSSPACGTMTVTPATFKQGDTPQAGGIYYVTPGSTIIFDVEGLANLASITFNVPGPNDTLWRTSTSPRKLDFPGVKAEVQAVVPQQYGWVNVSAEAAGLNGATIQCGAFFVDNSVGENTAPVTSGDPNVPATTPEPSS